MDKAKKKIALLHRYPKDQIKETNASFPFLRDKGIDVLTFKKFDRLSNWKKQIKSFLWIFYSPFLVLFKGYDVIYCDDSYPFYPIFIKLFSPRSKVILRIGDFHLMYYFQGWIYNFLHFFERIGWLFSDRIIAISDTMASYLYFETPTTIDVVLDPVDPNDFPYRKIDNDGSVMFHGVLTRNKNIDLLLTAARNMPDVEFIIVGDGPDRKRLQDLAPKNVTFKGWVPFYRMKRMIRTAAVGVALRSANPGNEYVVTSPFLQYGVMGKPCLVTRRKVFGDYEWQFSGVDELVNHLKLLLSDSELLKYEGNILRDYILKNHHAEEKAEEIWKILMSA